MRPGYSVDIHEAVLCNELFTLLTELYVSCPRKPCLSKVGLNRRIMCCCPACGGVVNIDFLLWNLKLEISDIFKSSITLGSMHENAAQRR